jgi:hypothetical protein
MNIEFSANKDRGVAYNNQRAIPRDNPCQKVTESARLPLNNQRAIPRDNPCQKVTESARLPLKGGFCRWKEEDLKACNVLWRIN